MSFVSPQFIRLPRQILSWQPHFSFDSRTKIFGKKTFVLLVFLTNLRNLELGALNQDSQRKNPTYSCFKGCQTYNWIILYPGAICLGVKIFGRLKGSKNFQKFKKSSIFKVRKFNFWLFASLDNLLFKAFSSCTRIS